MANLITAVVAIVLIIAAVLTLTNATLGSTSEISLSWDSMVKRTGDKVRTDMTLIQADIAGGGTDIDISFRNSGQTPLASFSDWDVIIRYYSVSGNGGLKIRRLAYTTSATPSDGQWTVRGIYINATTLVSEVYEPNIFNPGEEMIIRANITPAIPATTNNVATIGVTNGVTLSAPFNR